MDIAHYRSHSFHKKWMKFCAIVVIGFGPAFLLGSFLPTAEPTRIIMDILGWTFWGGQSFDAPTTRFVSALAGGFLIGWGVLVWQLATHLHDLAPEVARKAVVFSFLCWFVTDSLGSIASGHPSNAGFNAFFLFLCLGPLWLPAKSEPAHG